MLKTFTLKNGLKVATYAIPEMRSVSLSLSVKSGSIFDTEKTNGIAHFMEHMLVQGVPSLPNVEAFSDYLESLAISYNAVTYRQSIRFYASGPATHLENLLRVGSEVFFEPLFPEEALEKERSAILEEIKERKDSLWYKNYQFFAKNRFKKGHPLLLDGGGTEEVVKKLKRDDLIKFWSQFFHPKNTYLVVVGGFKNSKIEDVVEQYFGKYAAGQEFIGYPKFSYQDLSGNKVAFRFDSKLATCYLDLSLPSVSGDVPFLQRAPVSVIGDILAGLRRSRLYRLLRQQTGLVYSVDFGSAVFQHFGYAYISSQVAKQKLEEVVSLIAKELSALVTTGPTEEEVEFAKNYHIDRSLMQYDHPSSIASWIEGDLLWENKIYSPEEYAQIFRQIKKTDLLEFMKKYWDFSKLNLTIQGPVENSRINVGKFGGYLRI